jgi:hypothetical protein
MTINGNGHDNDPHADVKLNRLPPETVAELLQRAQESSPAFDQGQEAKVHNGALALVRNTAGLFSNNSPGRVISFVAALAAKRWTNQAR